MICDINIKEMKPNSVLICDNNGKFICISKDEFLQSFKNEISDILQQCENIKNYTEDTRKSIVEEISRQNERISQELVNMKTRFNSQNEFVKEKIKNQNKRINRFCKAIKQFIAILKGDDNNEESAN